jgi:hypothetical protein
MPNPVGIFEDRVHGSAVHNGQMASTKEAADRHVEAFNNKDLEGFVNNGARTSSS